MTKEQEKAIDDLNHIIVTDIYDNEVSIDKTKVVSEYNNSVKTVLNLIQTQQKEIEKKDKLYKKAIKGLIKANKIINSMANELIKNNIHKKYCYYAAGSTECSHNCRECIKEIVGGKQC